MPKKFIKLASKFKSDLKAQMREYEDLDTPLGQLESARRRGYKTAAEARKADYDEVFGYIERAKTPQQALKRSREMFPDQSYSVSTAIQYAGGPKKAFKKIDPVEKSKGGMLIKGLKKLAEKDKKKSRPDLESKAKRKKKMDAEKPAVPTLRRDMRNRVAEKQFKKATGSKPEFKKAVPKKRYDPPGIGDAKTIIPAAGIVAADKMYKSAAEKAKDKKKTGQMKRKPVKKAKGGMVTKWESKWG